MKEYIAPAILVVLFGIGFTLVQSNISDLRTVDMPRVEQRLETMDNRLRGIEIAFAAVDQRFDAFERMSIPHPEGN